MLPLILLGAAYLIEKSLQPDTDKFHLGGDMSKHLAPNGKPSKLTHEQWHLVRTPAFKKWFGDWENDAENASKVVDEETKEPLVVYHGTYAKEQFNVFDFDKADLGFHFGTYQQAKERSETKMYVEGYKSIINPYFLNIRKLVNVHDVGEWEYPQSYIDTLISENLITESEAKENGFLKAFYRQDNKSIREFLINKFGNIGFDYKNKIETKGLSYIVLEPTQIKIADGTNTTFDGGSPDIRYEEGGTIDKLIQQGIVELKMYDTTPEHAQLYGFEAKNPLFIQLINVSEGNRQKGIGKKILKHIDNCAIENGNDVIFGHITQQAEPSIEIIKSMLNKSGFNTIEDNNDFYKLVSNPDMRFEDGGRTIAQTPAPKKDRIYGSKVNAKGSASSEKSASKIKLSKSITESLSNKLSEFKKESKKDNVSLNDLKAVYRRGLGAYSISHRPTISGGKPNTRNAWAMARVNKFLLKASGEKVKKAYVQDDDLL
jgi:hypothetical protein